MRQIILKNKLNVSISLFIIIFTLIHYIKPSVMYDHDGSFREFGVGYKHKTVIPAWLVAMVLGIFCYMAVLYYLAYY
uniref:Uncharacterized protein n=1 Tax=viral metagenome TaxID=1070528 RepID=A0A6C0C0R8_9ZZZZ